MEKFFIGYNEDINVTEGLMQFRDETHAEDSSEEWCEVEAETLEEAFEKYEESFLAWRGKQSELYPTKTPL